MRRRAMRAACLAVAGMIVVVGSAGAQVRPDSTRAGQPNVRREMLEQRLRERTGELVRRQLHLTDDQMTRLQASNRQSEQQRVALVSKERDVRRELRQQIMSGDAVNQDRVAQLLDQSMQLERQRLDLVQNEQRELAKFLTPVQRAKLFGLQTELRRRVQAMRNGAVQRGGPLSYPRRFER